MEEKNTTNQTNEVKQAAETKQPKPAQAAKKKSDKEGIYRESWLQ